ncbi:MAG: xanthine dehydrogenase family protein molybdopterin-binding subunit, partial [Hyphomicrobiales bacterium]|nr:xanthine dehydrogenase family protein molybdopterin-binding subunit [Hyphomicrobiales bacterium]
MEPMNATAWVTADQATVWAPTQGQGPLTMFGAKALGLDPSRVTVHTTFLGGGFGRRFELDFSLKAMLTSRAVGAPVKLIWSREEDMRRDYYRPGSVARLTMGLDGDGMPIGFSAKIACSSIMSRIFPQFVHDGIDHSSVEGIAELPYALPAHRVDYAMRNTDIPVGFWRSVGNSQNGWFAESFIDEAAAAAGKDPYAFRMALLGKAPRHARVLKTAAKAAGWGKAAEGRHQGIALVESFGSIVAEVVELSVSGDKEIVLHKITVAADPGHVVDPRNFDAQLQSAVVYGLTAALYGEITIENGGVVEGNFDSYRMVKLEQLPAIDTHLIPDGTSAMGGAGEIATPPLAPALTNALFAATGERIRRLPLMRHGYELGRARS